MSFGIFQAIRWVPGLTWKSSMSNVRFQDSPGKLMYVHIEIVHTNDIHKKQLCTNVIRQCQITYR